MKGRFQEVAVLFVLVGALAAAGFWLVTLNYRVQQIERALVQVAEQVGPQAKGLGAAVRLGDLENDEWALTDRRLAEANREFVVTLFSKRLGVDESVLRQELARFDEWALNRWSSRAQWIADTKEEKRKLAEAAGFRQEDPQ